MSTFLDRLMSMSKPDQEDDPGVNVTSGRKHRPSRITVETPVFASNVSPGTPRREMVDRGGSVNSTKKEKRLSFLWG